MRVIYLLLKKSKSKFLFASLLSFLAGSCGTLIVQQVNLAIHSENLDSSNFIIRILILVLSFGLLSVFSTKIIVKIVYQIVYDLNRRITNGLMKTQFENVESKSHEIYSTLTYDVYHIISNQVEGLPNVLVATTIAAGCTIYLTFLSWQITIIILGIFLIASIAILLSNKELKRHSEISRKAYDKVVSKIEGLAFGLKELFQNSFHRKYFIEREMDEAIRYHQNAKIKENINIQVGDKVAQAILLLGISLLVVLVNLTSFISQTGFSEYLTVTLFMIGPLASISSFVKRIKPLNASLNHIEELGISFINETNGNRQKDVHLTENGCIELRDVTFKYPDKSIDHTPDLGPVTFKLKPGKITFITGGNGSGKTTLAKVLVGLYKPLNGEIFFNNALVDRKNINSYKDHFSVIFNENYVFNDLNYISGDESDAGRLIKDFGLENVVKIANKKYTTTLLSTGQRKRLALITTLLEDRPIYLFDEWAANQDLEFKELFYRKIIKDLKDRGKIVIVISHNEKYFQEADEIIKLENGKVLQITEND